MADASLNIYQKLVAVRRAIPGLAKDAQTSSAGRFKYVSSNCILSALRPLMDDQGLLLEVRVTGHALHDKWAGKDAGQNEHLTELELEFVWVNADNPEEKIACPWYGQGLDTGEKGVGKAATYAEKYFLLKFFNIPTDDDDPDAGNGSRDRADPPPAPRQGTQTRLDQYPEPEEVVDMETFRAGMALLGAKETASLDKARAAAGFGEHEYDQLDREALQTIYATTKGIVEERKRKEAGA